MAGIHGRWGHPTYTSRCPAYFGFAIAACAVISHLFATCLITTRDSPSTTSVPPDLGAASVQESVRYPILSERSARSTVIDDIDAPLALNFVKASRRAALPAIIPSSSI